MPEVQITLDCDVLQADGGTRTASICGAYVALHDACTRLLRGGRLRVHPLREACAAVSVGVVDALPMLDLAYSEDSKAEVDMNVVMTSTGRFVEVQGTAEGAPFTHGRAGRAAVAGRARDRQPAGAPGGYPGCPAASSLVTRFVLATANEDKAREIRDILGPSADLLPRPATVPDVEETGETLLDNARLKAWALVAATGEAAIADDTGLEVEALGGAPGVYSSRYAGEGASYAANVAKLVQALSGSEGVAPGPFPHRGGGGLARRAGNRGRGCGRGRHRRWGPGGGWVRLRPGVRPDRWRRADLRGDEPGRETPMVPPGPRLPGAGVPVGRPVLKPPRPGAHPPSRRVTPIW